MSRITEALLDRRLRVMLLLGTNMLSSFAEAEQVAEGLARQDLIVSYDLFMNETSRRSADDKANRRTSGPPRRIAT